MKSPEPETELLKIQSLSLLYELTASTLAKVANGLRITSPGATALTNSYMSAISRDRWILNTSGLAVVLDVATVSAKHAVGINFIGLPILCGDMDGECFGENLGNVFKGELDATTYKIVCGYGLDSSPKFITSMSKSSGLL